MKQLKRIFKSREAVFAGLLITALGMGCITPGGGGEVDASNEQKRLNEIVLRDDPQRGGDHNSSRSNLSNAEQTLCAIAMNIKRFESTTYKRIS